MKWLPWNWPWNWLHMSTCTPGRTHTPPQGDGTEQTCAATGAPEVRSPCARNAFTLLPYVAPRHAVAERDYGDATLRYGCKVRTACARTLRATPCRCCRCWGWGAGWIPTSALCGGARAQWGQPSAGLRQNHAARWGGRTCDVRYEVLLL